MNHKGTQPIRTERLFLREIKKSDWRDMTRYTMKEEVARYVSWTVHKSPDETKAVCKMWAGEYKNGDRYHWAIVYGGKVIGNIEIVKLIDATAILGWQIDSLYWNQGIMTEAATAVLDYMFSQIGIEAAEACHMSQNIGSGRVMRKIGMKEIPLIESLHYRLKHETEIDGDPLVSYRVTREEWEEKKR